MLSSIFGGLGGMLGGFFGGGMLSSAGRYLGKWIGDSLEDDDDDQRCYYKIGRVKNNLFPISKASGRPIPLIFGKAKVDGQLIWATPIREEPRESSSVRYFAHHTNMYTKVDFFYFCNFAIGICEGEIERLERIWANGELFDLGNYKHTLYLGTELQMPDPLITSHSREGIAPAHRGMAYIVFENFPLAEFGNNLPIFSFEVYRRAHSRVLSNSLEQKIKGVNIIPGSGEYVYDTMVQTIDHYEMGQKIHTRNINCNNRKKIADSSYSLDYLKEICPNIEWVSPVICWFGDSLDIGSCKIFPAIENHVNDHNRYSEEWSVAGRSRHSARRISYDDYGNPNYGGTTNDASFVRYLKEIKSRGIKITLYPMIFMDIKGKPWRGHLTGKPQDVQHFFRNQDGYNNFILHYARLTCGLVDAFIIGSELKGITKIRDGENFPAVEELINLAKEVKSIVGGSTKVTYAADWSEYHHTEGGWYNLDELWASNYIDFIGIDNYMPVTGEKDSSPSEEEVMAGFNSGEGYDYYLDKDIKRDLPAPYAWKNIRWFWENLHQNPNGKKTSWVPRSKKIWFTEYGFPSIDKSTNQPNIFFDPKCSDGGAPKYSNVSTNFTTQRIALDSFIKFWGSEEYIENMFLWCFDARPYPEWPHSKKWRDHDLWEKGHWINGKLGNVLLLDVIQDISIRCGMDASELDCESLTRDIYGIALTKPTKGIELVNLLRATYFFDLKDREGGGVAFVKRAKKRARKIDSMDLLLPKSTETKDKATKDKATKDKTAKDIMIKSLNSASLKTSKLAVKYINQENNYNQAIDVISLDGVSGKFQAISLPFVLGESEARDLASLILCQIHATKDSISFSLPFKYSFLKPSDIVSIKYYGTKYVVRICAIEQSKWMQHIHACLEESISLELPAPRVDNGLGDEMEWEDSCR